MRVRLKPLREQVIVVTGASSGIGLATAEEAARRGVDGLVLVARNAEALDRIVDDLGGSTRVVACAVDIADEAAAETIAATALEAFGGFDSWVNNAAAATFGRIEDLPLADHRRIFDVNYFGLLQGCLVAARHLRERGGAIVNIGSVLSDRAMIDQGAYSATKAAVQAATDALRMELERDQAPVSVTLIKPASIHTPYPEHARSYMDEPPRLPPLLYDPKLVADAVLFACETPRRHLYVGGSGWLISLAGRLAPRATDLAMEHFGRDAQQLAEDPGDPAKRDNLYASRRDGTREGAQNLEVRRTSLLLESQKNPLLTPFLLAEAAIEAVSAVAERARPKAAAPRRL